MVRNYSNRPLIRVCHDVPRITGATAQPGRLRYEAMSNRRPSFFRAPVYRLLEDLLALVRLRLTSRARLAAEDLFLRQPLALYQERRTKPRRPDLAPRVRLVVSSRWLDWRALLAVDGRKGGRALTVSARRVQHPEPRQLRDVRRHDRLAAVLASRSTSHDRLVSSSSRRGPVSDLLGYFPITKIVNESGNIGPRARPPPARPAGAPPAGRGVSDPGVGP